VPLSRPDLDQADAYADVEDLVAPDETIVAYGRAHVFRDLPRFVEWAAEQQHSELVPAEARDDVGVADLFLDEAGHLAQHVVARDVSACIVHGLETIEV
jgi:hypothetical protein